MDGNLLLDIDAVHQLLAEADDFGCNMCGNCDCQRQLLVFSMATAVSRQAGQSYDKVLTSVTRNLLKSSTYELPSAEKAPHVCQPTHKGPVVKFVYPGDITIDPSAANPVVFMNGVMNAISAILDPQTMHDQDWPVVRSCSQPSDGDRPDTITIKLCHRR